jgi:hypothetical protein
LDFAFDEDKRTIYADNLVLDFHFMIERVFFLKEEEGYKNKLLAHPITWLQNI